MQTNAAWWHSQQRQPAEHFVLIQYRWCCTLKVIQQTKFLAYFLVINELPPRGKNSGKSLHSNW